MKVGIAQIDCAVGDWKANLETIAAEAGRAAEAGCEVMLVPEMADTGYDMAALRTHASDWDGGPCARLREVAAEVGVAIICGLSERVGDDIYNSAAVIDRSGKLAGTYRKLHLFSVPPACEAEHFTQGDSLTLVELCGFRFGIMICYDIRFPELARALTLSGADVLTVSAAWPTGRIEHWRLLNRARAVENQAYVLAANRVGTDGELTHGGNSLIIDPYGEIVASANDNDQTLIVADIERERINKVRATMRVFDDRRADVYGKCSTELSE